MSIATGLYLLNYKKINPNLSSGAELFQVLLQRPREFYGGISVVFLVVCFQVSAGGWEGNQTYTLFQIQRKSKKSLTTLLS